MSYNLIALLDCWYGICINNGIDFFYIFMWYFGKHGTLGKSYVCIMPRLDFLFKVHNIFWPMFPHFWYGTQAGEIGHILAVFNLDILLQANCNLKCFMLIQTHHWWTIGSRDTTILWTLKIMKIKRIYYCRATQNWYFWRPIHSSWSSILQKTSVEFWWLVLK